MKLNKIIHTLYKFYHTKINFTIAGFTFYNKNSNINTVFDVEVFMDSNYAFTAGVRFGGLNDRTEIKILICYLLSSIKTSLTQKQLVDTIVGQELVNYFELQDALTRLVEQKLILEENGCLSITQEGVEISKELENSLPFSVKEHAYKAAIELLQYETLQKQNKTSVTALEKGGYSVKCTVESEDTIFFAFEVFMPDEKSAKMAQTQFIKHGQEIFKCVLGVTTENKSLYKSLLER